MKTKPSIKTARLRFPASLLAAVLATSLPSCLPEPSDSGKAKAVPEAKAPSGPTDTEFRILSEHASSESGRREFWETLTVVTGMLAVALFLLGTAIGSKGRRHAESN
jgi:hypothetical protein